MSIRKLISFQSVYTGLFRYDVKNSACVCGKVISLGFLPRTIERPLCWQLRNIQNLLIYFLIWKSISCSNVLTVLHIWRVPKACHTVELFFRRQTQKTVSMTLYSFCFPHFSVSLFLPFWFRPFWFTWSSISSQKSIWISMTSLVPEAWWHTYVSMDWVLISNSLLSLSEPMLTYYQLYRCKQIKRNMTQNFKGMLLKYPVEHHVNFV